MIVSTIGYEGSELDDFIAVLKRTGVDLLVDVRDLPLSRKRGFSKNSLRSALEGAGIDYEHMKVLGDPKSGREAARKGEQMKFRQIFLNHIATDQARAAVSELLNVGRSRNICIMCFERDHRFCHRNILIESMKKLCNFEVRHLGVPKGFSCEAA